MATRDSSAKRLGPCALPGVLKSFLEGFPDSALASEAHTSCLAYGPLQSRPCQAVETALGLTLGANVAPHPAAHCPRASRVPAVTIVLLLLEELAAL